ncbi:hypothetical protein [Streptomyces sp. NPDC088752]|uniref:hypothetical protein n=1 Tax=Streptomyces sp. NPDC088752 TaxID=3154963 RepID=UPI00341D063D
MRKGSGKDRAPGTRLFRTANSSSESTPCSSGRPNSFNREILASIDTTAPPVDQVHALGGREYFTLLDRMTADNPLNR